MDDSPGVTADDAPVVWIDNLGVGYLVRRSWTPELPADWRWCGQHATANRLLTPTEADAFLMGMVHALGGGAPRLDVLAALIWPLEVHGRSVGKSGGPCGCP